MSEKLSLEQLKELGSRLTDEERREIKGALRRAFRMSPRLNAVMQDARVELPPALKKDGKEGKRNQVRYKCAVCQNLFQQKNVVVDHISPVIPLYRQELSMSIGDIVGGIYCNVKNLQVICSTKIKDLPKGHKSCHYLKTQEENFLRKKWEEYKKSKLLTDSAALFYEADEENSSRAKLRISEIESVFRAEYVNYLNKKKKELEEKEARKLAKQLKKKK